MMRKNKIRFLVGIAVLLAFVAGACSSDDSDDSDHLNNEAISSIQGDVSSLSDSAAALTEALDSISNDLGEITDFLSLVGAGAAGIGDAISSLSDDLDSIRDNISGRFESLKQEDKVFRVLVDNYPPYVIIEDEEIVGGLNIELLDEIFERMGVSVEMDIAQTFQEGLSAIEGGQADLYGAPIWGRIERALRFTFSDPYLLTDVRGYKRVGDNKHNSAADIDSTTRILKFEGEEAFIESRFPDAIIVELPEDGVLEDLFDAVRNGEADIFFMEAAVYESDYADSGLGLESIPLEGEDRFSYSVRLIHPLGNPDLLNAINLSISVLIEEGFVDALIDKYFPDCDRCIIAPDPY